jgi:hypothetical protein
MTAPIPPSFEDVLASVASGERTGREGNAIREHIEPLVELLGRLLQILHSEDTATARAESAAQCDQLRELVASVDRSWPAGSVALIDFARVGDALLVLAERLRSPTLAGEADGAAAIAELRAALGPLAPHEPVRDVAAIRAYHRQKARAAMDDHFRRHPRKPFKP